MEGLSLSDINSDVIARIREGRLDDGAAHATVNRTLAMVRAILRKARDEWECNITIPKIRMLPEPKRRIRWITREEAQRLCAELPFHLRGPMLFTLATGLRAGNVRKLRWSNVDMARRVAIFSGDEMKGGGALGIPLNDDAMSILESRVGDHKEFVFSYKGQQLGDLNTPAWRRALERAGIEDFRWHDLRHTWASWHIQAGTPVEVLQELGGWASLSMVMRYAHLAPQHLATFAGRIDNLRMHIDNPAP